MDGTLLAAWAEPPKIAVLMAALLAAVVLGVRLTRLLHLPRVVGFIVMGVLLRVGMDAVLPVGEGQTAPLAESFEVLKILKSLALVLILFSIGASFDRIHLHAIRRHIWKLSLIEVAGIVAVVFLAVLVTAPQRPLLFAVFLAIAAVETAPAATLLVLRQYEAKGPATDHIIAMTGLNNLAAMVLFYIAFLLFAELGPERGGLAATHLVGGLFGGLLLATVGSALAGCLLGLLLSLVHIMLSRFEMNLIFWAAMLAVSALAKPLGVPYNALIVALFAGVTFVNFSIQPHPFLNSLDPYTGPVFALFFVLAGVDLQWMRLPEVGLVGVAYLVARAVGKVGGAYLGVRRLRLDTQIPPALGTAMLCQAGVAIGLGKYLVEHWGQEGAAGFVPDPAAAAINAVILASVAVFELVGPVATKRFVVRAGEVKAISLLDRRGGSVREVGTILSRLRAWLRSGGGTTSAEDTPLDVRHAMRTNIDTVRDTATMSEVLHHVERSRFTEFYVVDEAGHLVGVIDFKDLRNLVFNPVLAQLLNAYDMANTAPPAIEADRSLQEALDLFHKYDVSSLPVIENAESRRLLGVLEQRDVLKSLHADEGEQNSH